MNNQLMDVLGTLANPIRLEILKFLNERGRANYSELLQACGLRSYSESGKLSYHINKLISADLIEKNQAEYMLKNKGKQTSKLLETINEKGKELFSQQKKKIKDIDPTKVIVREADYSDLPNLVKLANSARARVFRN